MSKVIVPGEIETSNDVQRRNEGVPIRDEDWQGVMDVAIRLGVASEN
jgi:LDH2 family malate/lactate/ureidoglycolate dehydrogenase